MGVDHFVAGHALSMSAATVLIWPFLLLLDYYLAT
jgi:hypothetical protein